MNEGTKIHEYVVNDIVKEEIVGYKTVKNDTIKI